MKIRWNKVTWYSKLAAVIIFGLTFVLGLLLGMQYQFEADHMPVYVHHSTWTNAQSTPAKAADSVRQPYQAR
jgi:hypothetical protein